MRLTGDRCRCGECGEHFNSTRAFDKHRKGDYGNPGEKPGTGRWCLSEFGMEALGMAKNAGGFWVGHPESLEDKARRRIFTARWSQNTGDRGPTEGEVRGGV